jgi:hypothetical protein
MSAQTVYHEIEALVEQHIAGPVDPSMRERLVLLVLGMLGGKSASPARIAAALKTLGVSGATMESLERRIRRIENDPEVTAALCLHPLIRYWLVVGKPKQLVLIVDPTYQEERVVLVAVGVWYRGRALPIAWVAWPGNVKLKGKGMWQEVARILETVQGVLPKHVPVTWLADRAFGTPAFTDLVVQRGWHFVVRVQDQTLYREAKGEEKAVRTLVGQAGERRKLRGQVFKKRGWREASVVIEWGKGHQTPLCVVSDLPAEWALLKLYRRRFAVEGLFRDYKTGGWQWEQGQVKDLAHLEVLLVGMAWATWVVVSVGEAVAEEHLAQIPTGKRQSRPPAAKTSVFQMGLQRLQEWMGNGWEGTIPWGLRAWAAPNWSEEIQAHYRQAWERRQRSLFVPAA